MPGNKFTEKNPHLTYHLRQLVGTASRIGVIHQSWERDMDAIPHQHDFVEIVLICSGCGVNRINRIGYPAMTGDVYVIRPGEEHTFHTATHLNLFNIIFRPAGLFSRMERTEWEKSPEYRTLFVNPVQYGPLRFTPEHFEPLERLTERLEAELASPGPVSTQTAKALLILILREICSMQRHASTRRAADNDAHAGNTADRHLARILDFVNRNFTRPLPAEEIAHEAGISPDYLSDFFRARTGTPLVKYINSLRIAHAGHLLRNRSECNVTEIAALCGFADSGYFTRLFRKNTGLTPTDFRRSIQIETEKIWKKSQKKP